MRYHEIITNSVTEALDHSQRLLFHGTTFLRASEVIADDQLDARTTDNARGLGHGTKGVSLTRSYQFATNFRLARRSVVFVLDGRHLVTQPVAYWSAEERRKNGRADEMEEYHIGPIAPLSRYLISINSVASFDMWYKQVTDTPDNPYEPAEKTNLVRQAIERGFPMAKKLWNRWKPVQGVAS
jgi:hypothetical protein